MSATQPRFTGAPSGPGAMGGPARAAGRFTLGQTAIWPVALACMSGGIESHRRHGVRG